MPTAPIVVLDMDGTLIDTAPRHYAVYALISNEINIQTITFNQYWDIRRRGFSNLGVLQQNGLQEKYSSFAAQMWARHIETDEMLILDKLYPGVKNWLVFWNDYIKKR